MISSEIWLPVKGFEGLYEVSNLGRVRNTKEYKILSIRNNLGYSAVRFNRVGKQYFKVVHRLVAEAFLPNPDGKRCVNHKNRIKTDNNIENLEWCTHRENTIHWLRKEDKLRKNPRLHYNTVIELIRISKDLEDFREKLDDCTIR